MLRAAMSIIAQKGAAGATLAEIGLAAGFSRGLPAERFGTKFALLNALMDFMEGWFAERLHKALGDKAGLDALRARIDAHVDGACASPVATAALYSLFVESLCAIPELQPRTRAISASFHDGFRKHLEQARRGGELREGVDCAKMANILVGMLRGLIIQSLLEGDTAALATNRAQIHAFIDAGLRRHGNGTRRAPGPKRRNG
ncbi:TetR family transcriptional regulator C-terminal domain-containing protein [Bradyrhizobium jicamae]|uniref:TetR family transcriptional regulator C-terminal domain-containing protein n=1 Tax=Bradyrhizobium jicamae TaxID=280332 RepID=A0ABS5FS27_9BRAD|nr:TetR/AcrR family transcriptional regulator [Bradyrhizobium jicamae]MBR0799627.1 TetR family transcriptional regulator C-terminal domain-containing protein [Bradyrhizobium jicamae]